MKLTHTVSALALLAAIAVAPAVHADDNEKTQNFVKKASVSSMFEIESSKLALQKSQNADVKKFAEQMITDHTKASKEMTSTIQSSKINAALIPQTLDDKHQKMLDSLEKAEAKEFDEDYVDMQVDAHEEATKLFSDYAEDGTNSELKGFAAKTLPTLKAHEDHIKQIEDKI